MHQLISILEIVAVILASSEHTVLQSCLRVNRLFSHESVRIFWCRCGAGFPPHHYLLPREPTIRNLVAIAARNVSRAQYYANFIHELRFIGSEEDWPWPEVEQRCNPLKDLQFPALQSFTAGSHRFHNFAPEGAFNELLFEWLEQSWHVQNSPNLKSLHLLFHKPYSVRGMVQDIWFIKFMPVLASISVDDTSNIWPLHTLQSLAALPALRKLEWLSLSEKLLRDLPNGFPLLKELATKYTGSIDVISSLFPNLSTLTLQLSQPNLVRLDSLAALASLTSLYYAFYTLLSLPCKTLEETRGVRHHAAALDITYVEGSSISASDLLALAHGCPELKEVKLPGASELMMDEPCPNGESIDDTTIDRFARALPKLQVFTFGLANRSTLTYKAVVSLARYCSELSYFHLAADIFIPDLIQGLEETARELGAAPLPSFSFMAFYLDENIRHTYGDIGLLASRLAQLLPGLCEFSITDGGENDEEFQREVDSVACYQGLYSS